MFTPHTQTNKKNKQCTTHLEIILLVESMTASIDFIQLYGWDSVKNAPILRQITHEW